MEAEERIASLENTFAEFFDEMTILRKEVTVGSNASSETTRKFKVLEPKTFEGGRDVKALENFLWDIEQFF